MRNIESNKILLAHGGGGELSCELIKNEILSRFESCELASLPDAAFLECEAKQILFSTDSFVVTPWQFPGGNIGHLAVHGTVNDICVAGGKPVFLSLALILEEGLDFAVLRAVLDAISESAQRCNVKIVTGDTKVVGRGQCDCLYINTAGIGVKYSGFNLSTDRIRQGDLVLVSGSIGDHGMAVLSARNRFPVENGPLSDTGSVQRLVEIAHKYGEKIKFMRDPTRGGIGAVLNEIVENSSIGIMLNEESIPISDRTRGLAEILGIDVLNVACEGRMVLVAEREAAQCILEDWKSTEEGREAAIIGVVDQDAKRVKMKTFTGGIRVVVRPKGEILPRIC